MPEEALTGIAAIGAGPGASFAIRPDGTLIAWGRYQDVTPPEQARSDVRDVNGERWGLAATLTRQGGVVLWGADEWEGVSLGPAPEDAAEGITAVSVADRSSTFLALTEQGWSLHRRTGSWLNQPPDAASCPEGTTRKRTGGDPSTAGSWSGSDRVAGLPLLREDQMLIDTAFDFRTDAGGRDPDRHSPTLRRYHQLLWSKPLPDGRLFDLDTVTPGEYLHHKSSAGEFFLSSDSVIPTFSDYLAAASLLDQLPSEEVERFVTISYTIGGMTIFPGNRIDGKPTINGARGMNPRIRDRMDLTLECIRRFYGGDMSTPLGATLERYRPFFALFGDFPDLLSALATDHDWVVRPAPDLPTAHTLATALTDGKTGRGWNKHTPPASQVGTGLSVRSRDRS